MHDSEVRESWRAGKWTVQQAAELSVPAPTIEAALDGRFLSGLKDERVAAAKTFSDLGLKQPTKIEVRLQRSVSNCRTSSSRGSHLQHNMSGCTFGGQCCLQFV